MHGVSFACVLRVICTRCYELRVFYVGPGRSAVHGVSFACFFHVICTRGYEMRVFYVFPGRSAVHGVSFASVFTCNLLMLLRNACILRGSRKERGARGLFCICFDAQFAHVVTKCIYFTWVPEGAHCTGCTLGPRREQTLCILWYTCSLGPSKPVSQ